MAIFQKTRRKGGRKENKHRRRLAWQTGAGTQQVAVRKMSVWGKLEASKSSLVLKEER